MTDPQVVEVARQLSGAQRAAVLAHREAYNLPYSATESRVRVKLFGKNILCLAEWQNGAALSGLTPLGLAVRAYLENADV